MQSAKCKIHTRDRYLERLRASAFPAPSPFGVDRENQRVIEAHNLLVRWSHGRKENGDDLREFRRETLRIFLVLLDDI